MTTLKVEGISKRFGGVVAVNDLDLEVGSGEVLGIVGPNGAGKSTLFKMISGEIYPTAGRITLDDREISRRPPYRVCRLGVSHTHQLVRPFSQMSIVDNVRVGFTFAGKSRGAPADWVDEVLDLTSLTSVADAQAADVTVALQRRLELARALSTWPAVMLLDEVASGLTSVEQEECVGLIRRISAPDRTIIVVEHILEVVTALCRRMVVLNFGSVLAEGEPRVVMNDPAVIDAYLG